MKSVPVKDLKPGISFNKPVFIDRENIFVQADEVLSENDIARLTKWAIKEVFTDGVMNLNPVTAAQQEQITVNESKDIEQVQKYLKQTIKRKDEFKKIFAEAEKILNSSYTSISSESPVQISPIRNIAEKLITHMNDAPYGFIYAYLNLSKSTHVRHAILSAVFAIYLAQALKVSAPRTIELIMGILLMDVGMMRVPDAILEKSEALTEAEKQTIFAHTVHGYKLLTQVAKVKGEIANIALEHHEHFDGTGYPQRKKGETMHDFSRIASIVDSFTAMIETRSYKKSRLPYESIKELLTLGAYRYDAKIMKVFLDSIGMYPIGSLVEMSDGTLCMTVGVVAGKPLRPIVLVLRDAEKERPEKPVFVHLLYHTDKYITGARSANDLGISIESELDILGAAI
ncbi:MAG: HD domain-containing protein [Leptospiraceae bacterium]|nr:HD domain-containing protein [Leptospiraceae bacterium]